MKHLYTALTFQPHSPNPTHTSLLLAGGRGRKKGRERSDEEVEGGGKGIRVVQSFRE